MLQNSDSNIVFWTDDNFCWRNVSSEENWSGFALDKVQRTFRDGWIDFTATLYSPLGTWLAAPLCTSHCFIFSLRERLVVSEKACISTQIILAPMCFWYWVDSERDIWYYVLLVNDEWEEELDSTDLTKDRQLETNRDADSEGWHAVVVLGLERVFRQVRCLSNFSSVSELKNPRFFGTDFNIRIHIKAQMWLLLKRIIVWFVFSISEEMCVF
jgi:hypothetical protein